MNIILMIIIGLIAGWSAGMIVQGKGFGLLGNIIVGVLGALIGGWMFTIFGIDVFAGFGWAVLSAVVGSLILLSVVIILMPKKEEKEQEKLN